LKSWDLNNSTHASDKFETKVVENSGIQKQFRIIKVYLTKEVWFNCGMQDKKENYFTLGHE
jgi:DNA topoisomerase-3